MFGGTMSPALAVQSRDSKLVLDLGTIDAGMLPLVGGKAANLGEMLKAQLPVPPGFCVTTEAYRQVAESASIDFAALEQAPADGVATVAQLAREAIMSTEVPPAIAGAVVDAYARLGNDVPV